jgi:hypothetical protein
MLVNRDNWYMSPINELGRARPDLAPAFASVVSSFRELEPTRLEKVTSTAMTFDGLERAAGADQCRGLLEALYAGDIDYDFFDLAAPDLSTAPLALYAGAQWASSVAQERLRAYVEAGGTLVFFQTLPLRDDSLQPLNALGLREPDGVTTAADPQRIALALGSERVELSSPGVFVYDAAPGAPIIAERISPRPPTQEGGYVHVQLPVGERLVCGYVEQCGAGRVVVIGVVPTPALVIAVHRWLRVPIASRFEASGLTSAVFRRVDELVAICTNITEFDGATPLDVDVPGFASQVPVRVPPHSGTVLTIPRAGV